MKAFFCDGEFGTKVLWFNGANNQITTCAIFLGFDTRACTQARSGL